VSRKTACSVLVLPLQVVNGSTYTMNKNVSFMIGIVVAHVCGTCISDIERMDSSSRLFRISDFTIIKGDLKRGALVHLAARHDEAEYILVVDEEVNK